MRDARRAMSWALTFATLWTIVEIAAASSLARYSPFQVVWTRYLVHLLILVAWFGWRSPRDLWVTRRPVVQLVRSSLMLVMPASWILALQIGGQLNAVMTVFWFCPLFVIAAARLLLGEKAGLSSWFAAAAVAVGGALVFRGAGLPAGAQLPLALAMSISFSVYVVITRLLRHERTVANLFYTAFGVFVLLTPVMPAVWMAPTADDLMMLAVVGALGLVTLYALDRMAAAFDVSSSAPLIALNVPITVAFAAVAGSPPGRGALLGAVAIVAVASWLWIRTPDDAVRRTASNV